MEAEKLSEGKEHAHVPLFICFSFLGRKVEMEKVKERHFQKHGSLNLTLQELNRQKTEQSNLKINTFYGFISKF